ncbi:LOW QUALITY PROTEIN: dnaJ homolog subfamily C member 12 [Emys orbicularis]|uniref:LOW QUALITY PROTEIN: dnaJ homolog subfamily C member 12 n=1 Tax=Emys orbicularis TaxID=82168 RepID=UPI0031FC6842
MDAILNCNLDDMEDYYILLGCDELSTVEQILAEFKVKALECHPDKHPGNPKAVENFQKLQQAKEILTNEESRACYDYWRRSKITIPFQQWEALSNSIKTIIPWSFLLPSLQMEGSLRGAKWKRKCEASPKLMNLWELQGRSMHWAIRSKKEPMLEAPELNNSNNITNDTWAQQTENNKDGLSDKRREQDDAETSDEKPQSPKSPDSPRLLDANCSHLRFRWSGDAPSELLRKFRNYEI